MLGSWIVVGSLLGVAFVALWRERGFRMLVLQRVPLLTLAGVVVMPLLAWWAGTPSLVGVFAQEHGWQIALVVLACVFCCESARLSLRLVRRAAPLRFAAQRSSSSPTETETTTAMPRFGWRPAATVLLLTSATALASIMLSVRESSLPVLESLLGALAGLLAALVLLWLADRAVSAFGRFVRRHPPAAVVRLLLRLPPALHEGYLLEGRLFPGHTAAIFGVISLSVAYVLTLIFHPEGAVGADIPALCYVFLIGMFLVTTLSGITFFFDRLRLPVLLVVVLCLSAAYGLRHTDHYFALCDLPAAAISGGNVDLVSSEEALERRLDRTGTDRIVVFCAAGGGIQAAGWCVEALTRLDEDTGGASTRALACVSGVSGGSVGTLQFLELLDRRAASGDVGGRVFRPGDHEAARQAATRSSLTAAFWGWWMYDLSRAVPFFPQGVVDRGFAIEQSWSGALPRALPDEAPLSSTLWQWSGSARAGTLPAVLFNATGLGDGRRMIFASVNVEGSRGDNALLAYAADVPVVAAARMSATFPYVTPIARPARIEGHDLRRMRRAAVQPEQVARAAHLGDGGYFDNLGVVSALEWLRSVQSVLARRRIQVAIVSAVAFPEIQGEAARGASLRGALEASMVGPLLMLFHVREGSQVDRAEFEQDLLRETAFHGEAEVQAARARRGPADSLAARDVERAAASRTEATAGRIPVACFELRPGPDAATGPLNWHLSRRQRARITSDFDAARAGEYQRLVRWLQP